MENNDVTYSEFKISDLFSVSAGDCLTDDEVSNGKYSKLVPYICRGVGNNGCVKFVYYQPTGKGKANSITIGTQGAIAYYQKDDFVSGTGVNILTNKNLNVYNSLYISTVLTAKTKQTYVFGYELSKSRLESIIISLPSKTTKNEDKEITVPDWDYMTNYIKELLIEVDSDFKNIKF